MYGFEIISSLIEFVLLLVFGVFRERWSEIVSVQPRDLAAMYSHILYGYLACCILHLLCWLTFLGLVGQRGCHGRFVLHPDNEWCLISEFWPRQWIVIPNFVAFPLRLMTVWDNYFIGNDGWQLRMAHLIHPFSSSQLLLLVVLQVDVDVLVQLKF